MALKQKDLETIFTQDNNLVDFLNYIDMHDNIVILADGSLGKIWKLSPVPCESACEDVLGSLSRHIEQLITRLPHPQLACQVILCKGDEVSSFLDEYQQHPETKFEKDIFSEAKVHFLSTFARHCDVFFTVRFFPSWGQPSIFFKHAPMEQVFSAHVEEFQHIMRHMESMMLAIPLRVKDVMAKGLLDFLYRTLNPQRYQHVKEVQWQDKVSLREQVLFNEPKVSGHGFEFENTHMRMMSLKELPGHTVPGMFSREISEGLRACVLDHVPQMWWVINFTVSPLTESLQRLNWHRSFAFMHQDNWLGDKSIEALEKKKELDDTITRLYRDGERIVQARIHAVIWGKSARDAQDGADAFMASLSRLQCEFFIETMIGASLFLTCLPLGFDPYFDRFIKRVKRLASPNMADMLPLYGSFAGTKTPTCLYLNRRQQIVGIDFFDSNINPHAVVIGASGAGKSFFMNDFILQNQRLGAHFFVLDKGDSYHKINRLLNGQYIRFDLNAPITINPFSYPPTPENLSFLNSLLSQMACGCDERDRLTREEEGLLQKAVSFLFENHGGEATLSDLVGVLNDNKFNEAFGINSLMGPTLALRLTPFTRRGPYGGFFDGPNQFHIQGSFTVFELAHLSAYSDLQVVVLLNLMFFMTHFVSESRMRPLRKYLLIDEAWSLLKVKNTADFITNAFKTFRKYRCCVTAITQEIADLTRHESGLAIIANAANKVFLRQEAVLIDVLEQKLSLEPAVLETLKTLETVKGKFSEAFFMSEDIRGVVRLYPDPLLYWVANSEARNNTYLEAAIERCDHDFKKALAQCVKEHPYGVL